LAGIVAAEARGVRLSARGSEVLGGVDLMVFKNEVAALLGSPAGEALLCLWAGVWRPNSGSVSVLGLDPHAERGRLADRVGFIPPGAWLPPELDPESLASVAGASRGLRRGEAIERLRGTLRRLGWEGLLGRRLGDAPMEGRRAVATALAMLHDPELLLLSSPLRGLGPRARLGLSALLRDYASRGRAVVLTADSVEEVAFANRLVLLEGGRVAASGPMEELAKTIGAESFLVIQAGDLERTLHYLGRIPQVKKFSVHRDGSVRIWLNNFERELPMLLDLLQSLGLGVRLVEIGRMDYQAALLRYLRGKGGGG